MGRPRKEKAERRTINFTIRLTEEEMDRLVLLARQCGKSPAVVIRDKVFKGKFPEPRAAVIDRETFLELKKIGVNLNQLTHKVNSGFLPADLMDLLMSLNHKESILIKNLINGKS